MTTTNDKTMHYCETDWLVKATPNGNLWQGFICQTPLPLSAVLEPGFFKHAGPKRGLARNDKIEVCADALTARPEFATLRVTGVQAGKPIMVKQIGESYTVEADLMTPWARLGIEPNASRADVQEAYRKLSRTYHPDKRGGSNKLMLELTEARDMVLLILDNKAA